MITVLQEHTQTRAFTHTHHQYHHQGKKHWHHQHHDWGFQCTTIISQWYYNGQKEPCHQKVRGPVLDFPVEGVAVNAMAVNNQIRT